jgi:hypothetical protein
VGKINYKETKQRAPPAAVFGVDGEQKKHTQINKNQLRFFSKQVYQINRQGSNQLAHRLANLTIKRHRHFYLRGYLLSFQSDSSQRGYFFKHGLLLLPRVQNRVCLAAAHYAGNKVRES